MNASAPHPSTWVRQLHQDVGRGIVNTWTRPDAAEWTASALDLFQSAIQPERIIHQSRYAVVEKVAVGPDRRAMVFKRYRHRDRGDFLKQLVRPSRARRDLTQNLMVMNAGFRSMNSLCLLERRTWGVVTESALLTEWIDGAPTVRAWLAEHRFDWRTKRTFLEALAMETARFHQAGLFHGDMRLTNILCRLDGGWIFHWIDNERSRRYPALPPARRVRNLMQLNMDREGLTRTDRMRFWKTYAEAAELPLTERHAIARQVIRWTQKRWRERGWL